jgi:predicted transcriptional regulator
MKSSPKPLTPGGLVRKCCYVDPEEAARLRRVAFELERSESDLMREAISELLDRLEEDG